MRWYGFAVLMSGLGFASGALAQLSPARIPQSPDIHGDRVAFATEGDIWVGDLTSGSATRLTRWPGAESQPRFSPDGTQIAFTGTYDGRSEVYVMNVAGGTPARVTFDPTGAETVDWMPDGRGILFRSYRDSGVTDMRLFVARLEGGTPEVLPMPMAAQGSFNTNGSLLAYTRIHLEDHWWKRYQGGMANDIWVHNRTNGTHRQLTKDPINEQYPVFALERLFFVSEKAGTGNLVELNLNNGGQKQVTQHSEFDVQHPNSDGKRIVYRLGSDLYVFDPVTAKSSRVALKLTTDKIHALPHKVPGTMEGFGIGPTGKRLLIESRGQIFNAPAESGDIRPVASWPGARNHLARWSPNGRTIAFVSDKAGEQNVWVIPATGGDAKQLTSVTGKFFDSLQWSPNSKFLLALDQTATLWKIDAETGAIEQIMQDQHYAPVSAVVSNEGRFVAYVKAEAFNQSSIWLYDTVDKKHTKLSQQPTQDFSPAFDRSSRYLYFISQRNVALDWDAFDFQMNAAPAGRILFYTLTADAPNPIAEKVDEERIVGAATEEKPNPQLVFDIPGASERIQFVPGVTGTLSALSAGSGRIWWIQEGELKTHEFSTKKTQTLATGVSSYQVSADGQRIAVARRGGVAVGAADAPLAEPNVSLTALQVPVEPEKEWRHVLREGWRYIRDHFYDPKLHGADWNKVWQKLEPQLASVADRSDLNDLIGQMQAEVNVSHMYNGGGYNRFTSPSGAGTLGFLGGDFRWDGAGMRIFHLFRGDGFDENSRSPLLTPGASARVNEYIVAIDGQVPNRRSDVNQMLQGKAGQLVKLRIGPSPDGEGSREILVRTMASERRARYYDWVEKNRTYVQTKGGANLAYVHIPDMGNDGMAEFTKHFYANLHKDGIVVDVRYNGGGITSGLILERLRRVIFEYDQSRSAMPIPYHRMGVVSKIVVLTNELTASDGEYFSTGFRAMKLGQTVGKRTWGGYAAVGGMTTIDGGFLSCPMQGSFAPGGDWLPDGFGFKPDHEIDIDAASFAAGRDQQLDKALEVLKDEIKRDPPVRGPRRTPPIKK